MKSTISCIATAALILGLSAVFGPTPAYAQKNNNKTATPATATPAAPAPVDNTTAGPIKVRVVNVREVMKAYKKVEREWAALKSRMETMQKEVDAQTDKAKADGAAYDKEKANLSPDQQAEKEKVLKRQFADVQAKIDSSQRSLNADQDALMKVVQADITKAILAVGNANNIDLILNGSDVGTVLYSAPNMDLTQTVITELNKTTN